MRQNANSAQWGKKYKQKELQIIENNVFNRMERQRKKIEKDRERERENVRRSAYCKTIAELSQVLCLADKTITEISIVSNISISLSQHYKTIDNSVFKCMCNKVNSQKTAKNVS